MRRRLLPNDDRQGSRRSSSCLTPLALSLTCPQPQPVAWSQDELSMLAAFAGDASVEACDLVPLFNSRPCWAASRLLAVSHTFADERKQIADGLAEAKEAKQSAESQKTPGRGQPSSSNDNRDLVIAPTRTPRRTATARAARKTAHVFSSPKTFDRSSSSAHASSGVPGKTGVLMSPNRSTFPKRDSSDGETEDESSDHQGRCANASSRKARLVC